MGKVPLNRHIIRSITDTNKKSGKINKYNGEDHIRKGHDTFASSRVKVAKILEEAKQ